jgi:hypothetical protein
MPLTLICILVGAALALAPPSRAFARPLAALFLALSVVALAVLVAPMAGRLLGLPPPPAVRALYPPVEAAWHLLFGLCVVLGLAVPDARGAVVRALAVYVAGKFLFFDLGKALHNAEMEAFFAASGLPVWLHYAVTAAEVAGAAGLLLHRWLRTGPWATAGLSLIMVAAILTHARNHDPLADSHDAIKQLVYLIGLAALFAVGDRSWTPGRSR